MWLCNHCQAMLSPFRILSRYPTALLVPSAVLVYRRLVAGRVPLQWDLSRSILNLSRGSQNKYDRIEVSTDHTTRILLWTWPKYRISTWGRSQRTCRWGTWFLNGFGRLRYRWVWFNIGDLFLTWLGCSHLERLHADFSTLTTLFFRVFRSHFLALYTVVVVFRT